MKRSIAFFMLALLILSSFPMLVLGEEAPEDVVTFAEDDAAPKAKEFIKDPANGAIGSIVASAEEVDELTLGSGMRIYEIDGDGPERLSDWLITRDDWCFSLDGNGKKVVLFNVHRDGSGRLSDSGVEGGANLNEALAIMERLAAKANVTSEPKLCRFMINYVLLQSFNGDERVITIPTDIDELDKSYRGVTDYRELPTGADLIEEIRTTMAEAVPGYYGAPSQLLPAHPGVLTGEAPAQAPSETEVPAADKLKEATGNTSPLWYVIPAAIVVIAAAAVIIKRRAKKA